MDRHIVYPGSTPLDTDLLNATKDAFYGDGWLAYTAIGTATAVSGLAVTPTSPASLQVNVAPGAIYSLQTVDASAYGSLGTDANQIVKQGLSKATSTLTITPPGTVGQSINYLVQVAFSEADSTPVVLPYYNASNPAVAWAGPNNSGTVQNTVRKDTCVIGLKAGTPAATGSQTTPAPDAGYTGIYVITVANGQTTITSGNISKLSTAPFVIPLPQIPSSVQSGTWVYALDTGATNAIAATLTPAPAALTAGMKVAVKIANPNTGASTLNVNGLGAVSIIKQTGAALTGGEMLAGAICEFDYNGSAFQLVAGGNQNRGIGGIFILNSNGSFTVPAGVYKVLIEVWGAGGGGGGGSGTSQSGGGGGAGGYAAKLVNTTPGTVWTCTVGIGGTAGPIGPGSGGTGGTTSVTDGTTTISATGGTGGLSGGSGALGGAPGNGSGGDEVITGGGGFTYLSATVAGAGGSAPRGGAGSQMGNAGNAPGGGGGGAAPINAGTNGASGLVSFSY